MTQNGTKNLSREGQTTNKASPMVLEVQVLTQSRQLRFWSVSKKKQDTAYVLIV